MSQSAVSSAISAAMSAYLAGDLRTAEAIGKQVLGEIPNHPPALVVVALVCARTGRKPAAVAYLQNAVRRDPACYEAHVALCTLLFSEGKLGDAAEHAERAIELAPSDPDSYRHYYRDLMQAGMPTQALEKMSRAATLFPEDPSIHQDVAALCADLGQMREAAVAWIRALELNPDLLIGWLKLGGLHLTASAFDAAIECGRQAVRIGPDSADAHILLALSLAERGGAAEAESHLRRAIEISPTESIAYAALGLALQEQGRFDEARPLFEQTLVLNPTNGQAYYALARSKRTQADDEPLLRQIEEHCDHPDATVLDRSYMHYALGKSYEDLSRYEEAMRHYNLATQQAAEFWFKDRPANKTWYRSMIDGTIETFTPQKLEHLQSQGHSSETPLLIVGMMRSGTTLVEQIVSSHSAVTAGGELTYWHDHAREVFDPQLKTVDEGQLSNVAAGYLELLGSLGPSSKRVTDKLPHNYAMLGFVLAAFPNARVIHVKRNPLDNCLSIFTTAFNRPPEFSLLRENIVFAYKEYQRLMDHWRSVLPTDRFLEVEYESLIANREAETRRMVQFAGLDWEDSCLHHERNERSVNTPSVWQVRQPIYKTSVERWRKFEPWLGEFRELA